MFLIELNKNSVISPLQGCALDKKLRINIQGYDLTLHINFIEKVTVADNSILIGKVYDNHSEIVSINFFDTTKINDYYGDFIYIYFANDVLNIYLSHSLKYKFYFTRVKDSFIFASNISLLASSIDMKLNLDWEYMLAFIQKGNLLSTSSPFVNIYELPYSCFFSLRLNNLKYEITSNWAPSDNFKEFKNIDAWGLSFIESLKYSLKSIEEKSIFLELSGGLDSSLLCFLLAKYCDDRYELNAINFYNTNDSNADERKFAMSIADNFHIPLNYIDTSTCLPFAESKFIFRPDKPSVTFNYLAMDNILAQYTLSTNSNERDKDKILVSGHGGDSLFFAVPLLESVVDAFICENKTFAKNKFYQLREHYNNPYLYDLLMCLSIYIKYLRNNKINLFKTIDSCSWLKFKGKTTNYSYLHPYFKQSLRLKMLPGRANQIENFFFTIASTDRQVETIYPLLNKYVVESAFSLPTYYSFDENFSRWAVRNAFSKIGGEKFANRKSKGQSTETFFRGVRVNFNYISGICMEGAFISGGHIDKQNLYNDLQDMKNGIMGKAWYINNLFCAELFINQWRDCL